MRVVFDHLLLVNVTLVHSCVACQFKSELCFFSRLEEMTGFCEELLSVFTQRFEVQVTDDDGFESSIACLVYQIGFSVRCAEEHAATRALDENVARMGVSSYRRYELRKL